LQPTNVRQHASSTHATKGVRHESQTGSAQRVDLGAQRAGSIMILSRRRILALATAASAAPGLAGAQPSLATLRRFIKMRGALDGRLVIGCVTGRYSGVVDDVVTPLFGVVSAVFSRYRQTASGFESIEFEQAYYTSLETGQALDQWQNPYTGQMVAVPIYSSPPERSLITPDLQFHPSKPPTAQVKAQHVASATDSIDGDIVFVEQVAVLVPGQNGRPAFRYRDNTVLRAKLADVDNPATQTTKCQTTFDATVSWRPWLNMGARPGHMEALGYGGFGATMASLPAGWIAATQRTRPDLLTYPGRALGSFQ